MTVRRNKLHFNDGVERAQGAIVRALAGSKFRVMPWQEVRGLVIEAARGVKLPPAPKIDPADDFPGRYYEEGKWNGWLDAYLGRRLEVALTYPQRNLPGYATGYSDGQLAYQHGEAKPPKPEQE